MYSPIFVAQGIFLGDVNILLSRFHDYNAITVYVGDEKAAFTIHRGPICQVSAYFKRLFDGYFKESSEKEVTLKEHMPESFDQFLSFAYSGTLDYAPFRGLNEEKTWMAYGRLYVLADYLQVTELKDTITGHLFTKIATARALRKSACITAGVIDYVYSNTVRHCGLRRLIVAQQ
jgi:hypothetical protein